MVISLKKIATQGRDFLTKFLRKFAQASVALYPPLGVLELQNKVLQVGGPQIILAKPSFQFQHVFC